MHLPPRSVHGVRWFLVCSSLYVGALIYGLDTTIAADIQAAIIERFGDVSQLTWVGTGFPLGSVCAILPCAAFYAVYDVKILFLGSILLFEAGSALCGAAPTMNALIVGRVLAGVGGSGVYIGILNYISMCTSDKERGRYMSGIGLVWGLGAILGPVVGGAFSTSGATWRWAFYINLVIAAICAPVYIVYLPSLKPPGASSMSALKQLLAMDWVGFILSTGSLVCFVSALTFGGSTWAWSDGRTISMFVVFGVLLLLTVVQQRLHIFTTPEARMVPPARIITNRSQVLLNIQTAATVTNIFIPLYYIPLYFQFVHGDTAMMAAVRLLPFILILVTTNMAAGFCLARIGYYWAIYMVTGILMTVGGALMFTINIDSPAANIYGYSVLLAIGSGLTFQAGYAIAGVKAAQKGWSGTDIQSAVSLQNISQIGGTLLSLLICGQIFQSLAARNLERALAGQGFSAADIRSAIAGTQSQLFESLTPELVILATDAITQGMKNVYALSMAAGVLSLVCALLMKKERLFGMQAGVGGGG
ncbi:putative efflux pump antibiotic resistance protein [Plenodomus tracheiphilus IPT5]|uniref:Efflux pump antibiotic resistance protein n=1 Tax=Plenodomus tracheiphilus IPT5 TaxID=1408161 RepID=A0A6A7AUM8_9PLEO|nr:putative efflux pump antibiotic resistance protein [Plenodomus tracheiphilus IPT5]